MHGFGRYSGHLVLSWALEHAQVLRRGRARIATGQGVHLNRPGMSSFRLGRALAIMTTTLPATMTVIFIASVISSCIMVTICMINNNFSSFSSAPPSSIYTAERQQRTTIITSQTRDRKRHGHQHTNL